MGKERTITKNDKILTIIGTVLCIILLPILIINVIIVIKGYVNPNEVPSIFGKTPLIVEWTSMEDTIMKGDLIFVEESDHEIIAGPKPTDYDVEGTIYGDIIAFYETKNGEKIVGEDNRPIVCTHRAVGIDKIPHSTQYIIQVVDSGASLVIKTIEGEYLNINVREQLNVNETVNIASVLNIDVDYPEVVWETSNEEIATIDANGNIKGLKTGSVTIKATVNEIGYITQGDNNNGEDLQRVTKDNIIGVYAGRIKGMGNFLGFFASTPGLLLIVGVPVIGIVAYDIIKRQLEIKKEQKSKDLEKEEMEKEIERLKKIALEKEEK